MIQNLDQKFVPYLKNLGLDDNEALVYLAMLQVGQAKVGEISRITGIQRTFVYIILEKMQEDGIVSTVEIRGIKRFSAISIDQLKNRFESQLKRFAELLPELRGITKTIGDKPRVKFFEGKMGIIEAQNDTLNMPNGCEIMAYYTGEGLYVEEPDIPTRYVKERVAKRIRVKAISPDTPATLKWTKQDKAQLRLSRVVPAAKFPFANEINIYGNKINILSLQGELIAVIIESESIAKTQKAIFELAWDGAKKYN